VAVGCAAPGPLDPHRGIVHVAPNIAGFERVPLADSLSSLLDGIPVFLDRDTVIAAIAEGMVGAAHGERDYVYVTVSTGVGGAIAEHEPQHVLEPMRRGIRERALGVPAAAAQVVPAALGPDVGMVGAVLSAQERVAGRGSWFA